MRNHALHMRDIGKMAHSQGGRLRCGVMRQKRPNCRE
jgi:hypothetical protein